MFDKNSGTVVVNFFKMATAAYDICRSFILYTSPFVFFVKYQISSHGISILIHVSFINQETGH